MASAKQRYYDNQAKKGIITADQAKTMGASLNAPSSTSKVNNIDEAKSFINSNQTVDANSKKLTNEPEIRASIKGYNDIVDSITGTKMADIKSPDAPNYEQSYSNLRNDYGVTALESSMNDLKAEADAVKTQLYMNKNAEASKGGMVSQNVVEGRVGEHEKAANERLMVLDDQLQAKNSQLQTSYGVIGDIMKYKGMDYEAAKSDYDSKFNQHIQMFNLVKGVDDTIKSEKEKAVDVARANLQIMYGTIKQNSNGSQGLTSSQKTMITKLEVQAGLPIGFYKNIEGTPISTTDRTDANGNKYVDILTLDPTTGAPKVKTIYKGNAGGGSAGNKADIQSANENYIYNELSGAAKGNDGFVDPSVWKKSLEDWQGAGGSSSDFFAKFGGKTTADNMNNQVRVSGFINPKDF